MNREQIEKAANDYANENMRYPGETSYESNIKEMMKSFADAFKAGAEWRINSVWHDAREEPIKEKGRWLAFCGGIKVFMCEKWHGQFLWSGYVSMLGIVAWAYVEDLLHTKGGTYATELGFEEVELIK